MKLASRSERLERRGTSSYLRLFRLRYRGGLGLFLQHDEGHLSAAFHRNRPSSTGESRLRALAASLCVKVRYVHAPFSLSERAVPAQSTRANEVSASSLTFYLSAARGGRVQRARPRLHSLPLSHPRKHVVCSTEKVNEFYSKTRRVRFKVSVGSNQQFVCCTCNTSRLPQVCSRPAAVSKLSASCRMATAARACVKAGCPGQVSHFFLSYKHQQHTCRPGTPTSYLKCWEILALTHSSHAWVLGE